MKNIPNDYLSLVNEFKYVDIIINDKKLYKFITHLNIKTPN